MSGLAEWETRRRASASEEELIALDALTEVFGDAAILSMVPGWLYVRGVSSMPVRVAVRFARWQKARPDAVKLLPTQDERGLVLVLAHARAPDGRYVLAGDPEPLSEPCCGYRIGSRDSDGTVCVACLRLLRGP